ncbi:MAG TPA: rcc01693 family protein [Devosia sp.]|nr:rcc01693 family protein [Devosia sp.]
MTPFPWTAAMQFGFGVLHLSSEAFWRLTPRELAAAWAALAGERMRPPGRDELAAMMERFPDGR